MSAISKSLHILTVIFLLITIGINVSPALAQSPDIQVGFVTDELGVNDNGFNQLAYQGFLQAQTYLGVSGTVYESQNYPDYYAALDDCATNNDLCLTVGFMMADATLSTALEYPETTFAGIDIFFFEPPSNLRGVTFAEDQAGYLAGVVGGMMTASDVIGGIGGMQIPPVEAYINGYLSGAMCHNPDAEVLVHYTGTFIDPALGATTAGDMISQGADVIFAPAGLTGEGAVLAATQADVWGIGVDTDWYDTVFDYGTVAGADKLLTSAMKLLGNAVYMTIEDFIYEAFSPGMVRYGLADGGVGLAPFHDMDPMVPQDIRDALAAAEAGIVEGSIDVWNSCQGEPPPEPGKDTWSVALGDLDADGDLDAFVGNTGYNQIWFNEGDAFFFDSGQQIADADTWAVALDDLDGDGDLDAFVGNTAGEHSAGQGAENTIWLNEGDGYFIDSGQRLGESATEALALGDIDGDGDVDAFVANTEGTLNNANTVWLNDGGGYFTLDQTLGSSASWAVALGDLDGDGDLDAFIGNMGDNKVWFNVGGGQFEDSGQAFGPAQARELVLDDFDGDGDLDAFVVSHFSQGLNVWINDGAGNFTNGQNLSNPDTVSLAMADLDGDSDTDAFIGNFDVSNQIYLNDGSGQFEDSGAYLDDGDHSEAVALGDLDGDGDVDAFVGNSFGQPNKVWLNDGNGYFEDSGQRMNGGGVGYQSNFEVHPFAEQVTAWNWPPDEPVTLTIDDPSNGEGVDFTDIQTPEPTEWNPDETFLLFDLYGVFDVAADHIVTLTRSDDASTHVVTDLSVSSFDPLAKYVMGNAAIDSDIYTWTCEDDVCYDRHEVAEGGSWSADFSIPGDEPGEEDPYPYPVVPWIDVAQWDEWGNATFVSLQNPRIQVWPEYRSIEGFEWPRGTLVELRINGELIDSGEVGLAPWDDQTRWIEFHVPEEVDLFPGSHVQLTGGGLTKDLFISALEVTDADVEADVLTGMVEGEGRVLIIPHEDWESQIEAIIDPPGVWTAYFAGMYNVNPGSGFNVIQEDFDGDGTWFDWWIPMPIIEVFDGVSAFDFTPNESVTISIYDNFSNLVFGPESRSTNDEGFGMKMAVKSF